MKKRHRIFKEIKKNKIMNKKYNYYTMRDEFDITVDFYTNLIEKRDVLESILKNLLLEEFLSKEILQYYK